MPLIPSFFFIRPVDVIEATPRVYSIESHAMFNDRNERENFPK